MFSFFKVMKKCFGHIGLSELSLRIEKLTSLIGKNVFCFAVVKNTLKLSDFICCAKKKKVFTLSCQMEYRIQKDYVFAFQTLKDTVFLHEITESLASMTEVLKQKLTLSPNVVLVKISVQQESSRNNHCSVKNLYHKFPVQPKDLDTIRHRNQYYLVCAPSIPRDFSVTTKGRIKWNRFGSAHRD